MTFSCESNTDRLQSLSQKSQTAKLEAPRSGDFLEPHTVTVIFCIWIGTKNTSQSTTEFASTMQTMKKQIYRGDPSTRQPFNSDTFNFSGPSRASEGVDAEHKLSYRPPKGMGNWKSCYRPGRSSRSVRTVKEISIYLYHTVKEISIYLFRTVRKFQFTCIGQ